MDSNTSTNILTDILRLMFEQISGTVFERAIRHSVYIYPTSECHVECAEIQVESIRKYICREFKFRQRKG